MHLKIKLIGHKRALAGNKKPLNPKSVMLREITVCSCSITILQILYCNVLKLLERDRPKYVVGNFNLIEFIFNYFILLAYI